MKNYNFKLSKAIVIGLILIICLFNTIYVVGDGEQAIVERFGEKIKVVKNAGIKTKIPFIDKVRKIKTDELYTIQYGYRIAKEGTTKTGALYDTIPEEAIVLTKGSYIVLVEAMIQFRIVNADDFYYNVDDPLGTLKLAFESVLRRNVQNKDIDDALLNKTVISSEALPELRKKIAEYGLGIKIESLEIQNIGVPDEVKPSYEDVINARNQKEEMLNKAKKYKNEKLPEARAKAYAMIEDAKAYKITKIKQAEGDVARFMEVYEKYKLAKEITKTRLKIETMEKILSTVKNKYILDINDDGTIKYLPLKP